MSNKNYAICSEDGTVQKNYSGRLPELQLEGAGWFFTQTDEKINDSEEYIDPETKDVKSKIPTTVTLDKVIVSADGVDVITYSNIPLPSNVLIRGPVSDSFEIVDGELKLTFDLFGIYRICISSAKYQNSETVIHAT